MYACLCGGYECGLGRQRCHCDDSALHHWQRQTHTQREGNRRKPTMTLCFLVPLCVISIWGGLYNGHMWVLTHRPFQWLTEEHSSSPNSPALLMYLALPPIYFPSPGLIPWLHSMSFFSTYSLTQLFFRMRTLGDDIIHTTRSTILNGIAFTLTCSWCQFPSI